MNGNLKVLTSITSLNKLRRCSNKRRSCAVCKLIKPCSSSNPNHLPIPQFQANTYETNLIHYLVSWLVFWMVNCCGWLTGRRWQSSNQPTHTCRISTPPKNGTKPCQRIALKEEEKKNRFEIETDNFKVIGWQCTYLFGHPQ